MFSCALSRFVPVLWHRISALCGGIALYGMMLGGMSAGVQASSLRVVVDIVPTYGLVAAVMDGIGTPVLLLDQRQSPHDAALRPSRVQHLQSADLVIWIGPGVTPTLGRPIDAIADPAAVVMLADAPGLEWMTLADGHHHDHADHKDHDDHDEHADHDDHADHKDHNDHHEAEDATAPTARDWHLWLDPHNAVAMARYIAASLAQRDPENAAQYDANLERFMANVARVDADNKARLAVVATARDRALRYVAVHDAYGYVATHYGVQPGGALSRGHDLSYSPRDVADMRAVITEDGADCVIIDTSTPASLRRLLAEGATVPQVMIDPVGWDIPAGPGHYPALLAELGAGFARCADR